MAVHPGWVHETSRARTIKVKPPPLPREETDAELTQREIEVLRAVCMHGTEGATEAVFVSVQTIKNHLSSVYRKLKIVGRGSNKIGRGCYELGRYDEREKRT